MVSKKLVRIVSWITCRLVRLGKIVGSEVGVASFTEIYNHELISRVVQRAARELPAGPRGILE